MNRPIIAILALLGCVAVRAEEQKFASDNALRLPTTNPPEELNLPLASAPNTTDGKASPGSQTYDVNRSEGLTEVAVNDAATPLDIMVKKWRCDGEDIAAAAKLLGHAYGVTITVEPDVKGTTTFEAGNCTLRDVLSQMTHPAGCFFEERGGFITLKKYKTVLYVIEYPQLQRSSSEQSTVTLSGGTGGSGGNSGNSGNSSAGTTGSQTGNNGGGSNYNDQTSLSISSENKSDLWTDIANELKTSLRDDESFFINKFSGIVQIRATPQRHEMIAHYVRTLNAIINSEVDISAQIVEVQLGDEKKLGIDWKQVAAKIGSVRFSAESNTAITDVGATTLAPSTFTASITASKLAAVIDALQQQGSMHSVSNPKITTMNNQAGYITVGQEQTFQFIDSTFDQTTPTTNTPYSTTTQHKLRDKYTFGVVMKAIPYVKQDRSVTIDLTGSISRMVGIKRETDGSTTPIVDVKRLNSMIRLRAGEAAIIGGMIQTSEAEQVNGTPGLSKIPFLGRAFRTEAKAKSRTELVIIVQAIVKEH